MSDLERRIDAVLAREVQPGGPGAAVGVLRNGVFVHRKAYGMAEIEHGVALEPDAVFRIASLTKQFTAVAIMMLAERGRLDIDAPLGTYLADWTSRSREITPRRLLNHTSGVWRHDLTEPPRTARENIPLAEILRRIHDAPSEYEPGARYAYNNSGYQLLGALVAAVSGVSFEDFLRTEIFEPLGMRRTGPLRHEVITPGRARGYVIGRRGVLNALPDPLNWTFAAGALGSTLDDLALWDRAIREKTLVSAATFETMLAPAQMNDGSVFPYGLGWGVGAYAGRRVYHHTGGISGYASHMLHLRDEDLTTILLSNRYLFPTDKITRGLLRAALDLDEPSPMRADLQGPDDLAACAGRYAGDRFEQVVFAAEGGLAMTPGGPATLIPTQPGEFRQVDDPENAFVFSEMRDGRYQTMTYRSPLWPDDVSRRAD
jgi:CubicO group peptidase (beta-lactamase class C family)